jgi:hypothetical protein
MSLSENVHSLRSALIAAERELVMCELRIKELEKQLREERTRAVQAETLVILERRGQRTQA